MLCNQHQAPLSLANLPAELDSKGFLSERFGEQAIPCSPTKCRYTQLHQLHRSRLRQWGTDTTKSVLIYQLGGAGESEKGTTEIHPLRPGKLLDCDDSAGLHSDTNPQIHYLSSQQNCSFKLGLHKTLLVAVFLLKLSPKARPQDMVSLYQTTGEFSTTTCKALWHTAL